MIMEQRCISNIRSKIGWLCDELQKHNAVIAGSFILQCALEEDYESDIDLFIPYTHEMPVCGSDTDPHIAELLRRLRGVPEGNHIVSVQNRHIFKLAYYTTIPSGLCYVQHKGIQYIYELDQLRIQVQPLENFIYLETITQGSEQHNGSDYTDMPIRSTRYYDISDEICINTVVVNNPIDFITETFDANLCGLYYDGTNIVGFQQLFRRLIHKIITFKSLIYVNNWNLRCTYERCKKYKSRGYTVVVTATQKCENCDRVRAKDELIKSWSQGLQ